MESRAVLRFAQVSARKARLVADLVRGKFVSEAVDVLTFTQQKTGALLKNLIESAVSNAEHAAARDNKELDIDMLRVVAVTVDAGPSLRRFRPRAQGRATRVLKKTSHITVHLSV